MSTVLKLIAILEKVAKLKKESDELGETISRIVTWKNGPKQLPITVSLGNDRVKLNLEISEKVINLINMEINIQRKNYDNEIDETCKVVSITENSGD